MSRRSIFLLTAMVVLLYFSIIVFMLSPLHGARSTYSSSYHRYSIRGGPAMYWCKELRYRAPPGPAVALVSYPGSGNTWLRYLLQQATGILTGSIYNDYGLKVHGFPAESVTNGSVLVVKTHEGPPQVNKFQAAILLIRNPRDAILADFNRLHKGHIGTAPKSAFKKKLKNSNRESEWSRYVSEQLSLWQSLHELWLTRFAGRVLLVFYELLVQDTRAALTQILDFLNQTIDEADMTCVILYKEGIYRRRKKLEDFDPYTAHMYRALDAARARVHDMVSQYHKRHNLTAAPIYNYNNVAQLRKTR